MQELNIRTLWMVLMQRLKWILLITLAGAVLMGAYTYFLVADTYRSKFSVYVMNVTSVEVGQSVTSSGLQVSRDLVQDYIAILRDDAVIDEVAANLRRQGFVMTNNAIRSTITMQQENNTAKLNIMVTTTNPHLSKAICDAISATAPDKIKAIMQGMGTISALGEASTGVRIGPNISRNVFIGALAGFVLGYAIFLLLYVLDNTVHDGRELKARLDVTVLGAVPSINTSSKTKKGGK